MNKNEQELAAQLAAVAAAITVDWETSEAKTISKKDVISLKENPPKFGVLDERGGRKIYAFLEGGIIKKRVIPVYSGKPQAKERALISEIERNFTLQDLHRIGK